MPPPQVRLPRHLGEELDVAVRARKRTRDRRRRLPLGRDHVRGHDVLAERLQTIAPGLN